MHELDTAFACIAQTYPGKSDIVLPRYKTVVMVHGCLWHGHGCKRFRWPVANADYWRAKIGRNMESDRMNLIALNEKGWSVKVVRNCNLRESLEKLLDELETVKEKMR